MALLAIVVVALAWLAIFGLSFRSPGAGLAFAAVVGRYEFPQRGDNSLFAAAPLILLITLIGLLAANEHRARPLALEPAKTAGALFMIGAASTTIRSEISPEGFERLTMLALYVVPLAVLASSCSSAQIREFRVWFVRLATLLAMLTVVVGSADPSGRAAALGGGPIPLAQMCMIGMLLVVMFDDPVLPIALQRRAALAVRILVCLLLASVGLRTASRFPVLAVAIAVGLTILIVIVQEGRLAALLRGRSRQVAMAVLLGAIGIVAVPRLASEQAGLRFALLATDLVGELERARGGLFRYSYNEAVQSLPVGHGPGNYPKFVFEPGLPAATYPHNIILEVAGDYGLLGIVALFYLVGKVLFSSENLRADRRYLVLAAYGLTIAFTSGDIAHNRYFFLFAAVLIWSRRSESTEPAVEQRGGEVTRHAAIAG